MRSSSTFSSMVLMRLRRQPRRDLAHQRAGEAQFAGAGQFPLALFVHQQQCVVVTPEGRRADVADDQAACPCAAASRAHVSPGRGSRRRSRRNRAARAAAPPRPGCRGSRPWRMPGTRPLPSFLILCSPQQPAASRPPPRWRRNIVLRAPAAAPRRASAARWHVDAPHMARRGQVHGAGHQRHLGAGLLRRTRDGKAHLAAGQVGDAAHRIDGLEGRPGRDQHASCRPAAWAATTRSSRRTSRRPRACGRRRFRRRPGRPPPGRGCCVPSA